MTAERPRTKILVDGGDPEETASIRSLLGFVDGQTTNPSLIAKNPDVVRRIARGEKLSPDEEKQEYKKIVQRISPLVGNAGVSIEVFADLDSNAEDMLQQGREMFGWIPNSYIKYPCTREGLKAVEVSVKEGIRVNVTLCFSQQQAAAVYAASRATKQPVYVSPFIGRLDDIGENGMDLVKNIKRMYANGDGHVQVLAASIRHLEHLLYSFALGVELVAVPGKVLREWVEQSRPVPDQHYVYEPLSVGQRSLKPIPNEEIDLSQPWQDFRIEHPLTSKGIQKFVADYKSTLRLIA